MHTLIEDFRDSFKQTDLRSRKLLIECTDDILFMRPVTMQNSMSPASIGEFLLRSGAMVEMAFGGITTRLWDDPFEWTLPEALSNAAAINEYLDEVVVTREKGLAFIGSDDNLSRQIPAPKKMRSLAAILIDAHGRAEHFNGRAYTAFFEISGNKPPAL